MNILMVQYTPESVKKMKTGGTQQWMKKKIKIKLLNG